MAPHRIQYIRDALHAIEEIIAEEELKPVPNNSVLGQAIVTRWEMYDLFSALNEV